MVKGIDERTSEKWVNYIHKIINITRKHPEQDNHWIIKQATAQEVIEKADDFLKSSKNKEE